MVDALDTEDVEGLPDVGGRSLLTGVGDAVQPGVGGGGEDRLERARRVPGLGGVEPDADDGVQVRLGLLPHVQRLVDGTVTQEAQDEPGGDGTTARLVGDRGEEPGHERLVPDTAQEVGLGVEEDLGPHHPIAAGTVEVGPHQVVEVGFGAQDRSAGVVEVEKRLQVPEPVGGPDLLHGAVGDGHVVPPGEVQHELWAQRALDVDVQLRLGCPPQPIGERLVIGVHRILLVALVHRSRAPLSFTARARAATPGGRSCPVGCRTSRRAGSAPPPAALLSTALPTARGRRASGRTALFGHRWR